METRTMQATTRSVEQDEFGDRVDQCLAMVLHYAEVQEIAALVKKVHTDRIQEKSKCNQKQ